MWRRIALVVTAGACTVACGDNQDAPFHADHGLDPFGLVVDAEHLYWNDGNGVVLRAGLDGAGSQLAFVGGFPRGIAIDDDFVYVAGGCEGHLWPLDNIQPNG